MRPAGHDAAARLQRAGFVEGHRENAVSTKAHDLNPDPFGITRFHLANIAESDSGAFRFNNRPYDFRYDPGAANRG